MIFNDGNNDPVVNPNSVTDMHSESVPVANGTQYPNIIQY